MNNIELLMRNRRHSSIEKKLEIWKLIKDSYAGGSEYIDGDYLIQYPRENSQQYDARKKRAVFFNHTAPLVDLISGFILGNNVTREYPERISHFINNASKGQSYDSFMQRIITNGLLYTCGVLVDCDKFDKDEIKTKAQRESLKLGPYGVIYFGWEIRDFETDNNNEIEWVLLDNSYVDKENPFKEPENVRLYRLWTKEYYQDFEYRMVKGLEVCTVSEEVKHNLKTVPFVFVNFRDLDDDYITESIFEDITIIDKSFYNLYSCLDEVLAGGSFKTLFFPITSKKDLPDEVLNSGVGAIPIVTYPAGSSSPTYQGAGIGETTGFIESLRFLIKEMFIRLGLDTDNERSGVQSGEAKRLEFKKTESILRNIAEQLENIEKKILNFVCLYESIAAPEINIYYDKNYINNDLSDDLANLYQLMNIPVKSLQVKAIKSIAEKTLGDEIDDEDLDAIDNYINNEFKLPKIEEVEEEVEEE